VLGARASFCRVNKKESHLLGPKNAKQSFARRRLKSMTPKSECNDEVAGPQADVSGMFPRNALQAASNPKSYVLRQIEYFYPTGTSVYLQTRYT
jgi:hypothetical protein